MLGVVVYAWWWRAAAVVGGGCGDAHPINVSYTESDAPHVLDIDGETFNMALVAFSKFNSESEVLGGGEDVMAGERHSEAQQTLKLAVSRRTMFTTRHLGFSFWFWENQGSICAQCIKACRLQLQSSPDDQEREDVKCRNVRCRNSSSCQVGRKPGAQLDQIKVLLDPALEQLVGMKLSTKERGGKRTERIIKFEVRRSGTPMDISYFGKGEVGSGQAFNC